MTASVPPIENDRQALDPAARPAAASRRSDAGPWKTALRKLINDRAAVAALVVFVLIVVACCCAPLYVSQVSHIDPFSSNIDGTITIDGQDQPILEPSTEGLGLGTVPIGPTWDFSAYFLGSDN
jgi:peptide/nickel transport system permease protein